MKKTIDIVPVAAPAAAVSSPKEEATAPVEVNAEDTLKVLGDVVSECQTRVTKAAQALGASFSEETLAALNIANKELSDARKLLQARTAEINAEKFPENFAKHLVKISSEVPHSVWGSVVRFEVTFSTDGQPSVRRVLAPSAATAPVTVKRNSKAAGVADARIPSLGWWFWNGKIVVQVADADRTSFAAWYPGGKPSTFGSLSSVWKHMLGQTANGVVATNLGSEGDVWSDLQPRKGWSNGAIPADLKFT